MARSEMRLSGNPAGDGFAEGQAIQGMSTHHLPEWLHGNISRRHAEELLQDKPLGCFLVRFSESRNGYTLSFRGPVQFRHFMIDVMPDARCIISGETRVHRSLQELVSFHTHVPIRPYDEYLTVPCGQVKTRSGEPCSLSPALGKERLTSPSGCFSAANIAPLSPSSASPAAAKPLLLPKPLKFQAGTLVPPPLPSRKGLVVSPGAQLDPTIPSRVPVAASDDSRGPVKKLYPSLQSELRALLQGNQIPTPKATTASHLPATTLPRHNSEEGAGFDGAQRNSSSEGQKQKMVASQDDVYSEIDVAQHARRLQSQPPIWCPQQPSLGMTSQGNTASAPEAASGGGGEGGSLSARLKGQTALLNIKEIISKFSEIKHRAIRVRDPEPQRYQPSAPQGCCNSAQNVCSASRNTNVYSTLDQRNREPQQVSTLHPPRHTRADTMATQPPGHTPLPSTPWALPSAETDFAAGGLCHGRDEECLGESGHLPEEYLIPPPYAPGYRPS
eukprot:gi/632966285/ref/XP_007899329.1/ PREDICTED: hematopoietic SH2 domain-containing protein homolog [Callorhinchus milii]